MFESNMAHVQGSVRYIDLINKIVDVDKGGDDNENPKIKYDYLIIALGSSNYYYAISGAQEYTRRFRSVSDALKLRLMRICKGFKHSPIL
jgi:NADH dehydrogenase FAD-containing subunit